MLRTFGQATDIQYTLDRQADVTLEVMDLTGRRVELLDSGSRQPGEHRLRFDAAALAPGLYILHLDADGPVRIAQSGDPAMMFL